jgi:DNA modification methylase
VPTELVWDGKYKDGKKSGPLRISLPFQDVETVNESAQERQRILDLFSTGRPATWRNRLIWGDKKYVLPSLLDEFAGQVNLTYIDPPFDTGADFSFTTRIPDADTSFTKEPSIIEQKAYRDTWGRGLDSYLQWFYETILLLHELLNDEGSIYVHIGSNVSHYVKVLMDSVFGAEMYINEVVWKRNEAHSDVGQGARHFGRLHDIILVYGKSSQYTWNQLYEQHSAQYLATHYSNVEPETGRRYELDNLTGPGGASKGNPAYEVMGVTRHWRYSQQRMQDLIAAGRVVQPSPGAVPRYKRYLDESKGRPLQDIWSDIPPVNSQAQERLGYATQKPEALLERIIKASSNEGDLVLDCFVGSGTTAAVAEKLNRRWIACDLGRFAIQTTRKRLLSIPGVKPFVVQNLGKYERQLWQVDEFGPHAAQRIQAYANFILDLYHAQPLTGRTWLHGVKGNRVVHVGSVDSPVTLADVKSIIIEWQRNVRKSEVRTTGIDVLGWDFAFELHEVARQQALAAGVDLKFYVIPREVMERKAAEQGDIQFFELAALFIDTHVTGRTLTLELTNFVPPLDYVPQEIRAKVTSWDAWIDFWAVDFTYRGDTFHNEWQSYRTKASPVLAKKTTNTYDCPGTYCVMVKVIDILGNDTTRTLPVEIA